MECGPQSGIFDLKRCLPSECADLLREGAVDLGLVPVIEMARQGLSYCSGTGIACEGEVRSILLVSKVKPERIRTLAADRGSRTSVVLARIVLERSYGAAVETTVAEPVLETMLATSDAALVIGDAALHLDPAGLGHQVLDLGAEWKRLTGLPMVFAVWSGRPEHTGEATGRVFAESLEFGLERMEEIVRRETASRELPEDLVRRYLTRHIRYRLGAREYEGLRTYLELASELEPALRMAAPSPIEASA
jgi:chorismate dehydratase